MGTNVKINMFGTFPVTSANVNKKNIATIFLTWRDLQIVLRVYFLKS